MPDPDLIPLFVHPLTRLGIRHLISGSVAAMLYGEPRVTHDVDLVVFLSDDDIPRLVTAFPAPEFYLPPLEVIVVEKARERRGHFNVIHSASGLKADFYLANRDELHLWAAQHARTFPLSGETITLAPPEYVILRKLEYYREGGSEKHIRDIRSMLAISRELIDRQELEHWVRRRHLEAPWEQVLAEAP